MSTDDYDRAEKAFGPEMRVLERLFGAVNPETVCHVPKQSRVIDLRKRYDIAVTKLPTLFRQEQWEAIDRVTFDPDPESRWCITGRGESTADAVSDLLEQLAAEVAKG